MSISPNEREIRPLAIASPHTNYALEETTHGLAHPSPTPGAEPRALCHPGRKMFADGLCEDCAAAREKLDAVLQKCDPTERPVGLAPLTHSERGIRAAMVELYRNVEYAEGVRQYAQALLVHALPEYAKLLLQAARVAAQDGDSRPMEFALRYAKMLEGKTVVDPPEKATGRDLTGKVPVGVQVMIGIQTGGLPPKAQLSAQVVDVEPT